MINPVQYLSQVKLELQKVTWPTKEKTLNMTILVVVISAILGLYLGIIDFAFNRLVAYLLSI